MGKKKVDERNIFIVMGERNLIILSRMGKKMDYLLDGMRMGKRKKGFTRRARKMEPGYIGI